MYFDFKYWLLNSIFNSNIFNRLNSLFTSNIFNSINELSFRLYEHSSMALDLYIGIIRDVVSGLIINNIWNNLPMIKY